MSPKVKLDLPCLPTSAMCEVRSFWYETPKHNRGIRAAVAINVLQLCPIVTGCCANQTTLCFCLILNPHRHRLAALGT